MIRVLQLLLMLCTLCGPTKLSAFDGMELGEEPTDKALSPGAKGKLIEDLEDMFHKLARSRNRDGLRLYKQEDLPGSLKAFQEAYELNRNDPEITNNLAHSYDLLGNQKRAEVYYRETIELDPERGIAYLNLGDLLAHPDANAVRLKEAALMLETARELRGNEPNIIYKQARVARWRGRYDEAKRYYERYVKREEPTDEIRFELAEFYRNLGTKDEALRWYRSIKINGDLKRKAATRIWDMKVASEAERYGWSTSAEKASDEAVALEVRARGMMRTGDLKGARRLLEDCLMRAPGFARAHMSRGDLARQDGQLDNAELSYLRALAIKPGSASFHLRLADLYLTEGVVHRPGAGAIHLSRALELKPEWIRLHLRLARVYQVMGKIQEARQHVDQFLASDPGEELKTQAGVLKRSLAGDRTEGAASKEEVILEGAEISTLVRKLNHARVLLSRGQPDAAMAQLRSLENHDTNILILNLEARILHAAGRTGAARECLTDSLGIQPEQPEILELLGLWSLLEGEPEVSRAYLLRAESKGSTHASFHLARLSLGKRGSGLGLIFSDLLNIQALLGARARLVGYLEQSPESIYLEEATGYLTDVRGRIRNLVLMALSLLLLVLAIVIGWRRKVWGGVGVVELLDQFPETGPEVQRILSAVRHEVLKHNTMVLTGLIDAIEQDAPFAEKGAALQTSLFGEDMSSGVAQKLRDYCSELEGIGRANRLRLNLRHRDRVMAPLIVGMMHLRACSTLMFRGENLGSRGRKTLVRSLKRAHRLLNVEGYEGIMGLIDVLRTLCVDRAYLTGVYVRTLREPGLKRAQLADMQWLDSIELPAWALIPRHAMDDILTNIVRNAVQSSMYLDESLVEIGLRVESDLDEVTGIERISVLVLDQSPQVLTTEMLRGRYIADGLGLTADLVSQYQGSLDVIEVEGWQKAVRVRVPRIYPEERKD